MVRLKIALLVLGGMLAFWGFQEFRVSHGATDEPIAVDLTAVEGGAKPENGHWKLGEHIAVYNVGVYQYSKGKTDVGQPGPETKVDFYYYPVLSKGHPFISQIVALKNKYPAGDIPDAEVPALNDFAVLVKTSKFKTIGAIPDSFDIEPGVQGLVINQIKSLSGEEAKLLKESFPGLNTDHLLLLEEGRKPASVFKSFGMMGGGAIMVIAGILWFAVGRNS